MKIFSMLKRILFFCIFFLYALLESLTLNAQCPDYNSFIAGTGEVCSGQYYTINIENAACDEVIYLHVTGNIFLGGWWKINSNLTGDQIAKEAIPIAQSSNYNVDTLIGPIDVGSQGTDFTLTTDQGSWGSVTIQIDQNGSIIADNNGNLSTVVFSAATSISSATLTVTTPSGDVTSTSNYCEDFNLQIPLANSNYCNSLSIDLPWNIICDSTGAVISSGIHTVTVFPQVPLSSTDIVAISWDSLACDWVISPNNDCDMLDIGNVFTIDPNPTTVPADICNDGSQDFDVEYIGVSSGAGCVPSSGITFTTSLSYTSCGPPEPIFTITPPTCSSDGYAVLDNYDNSLNYTFSPTGPTINSSGIIDNTIAGTSYVLTVSNGTCSKSKSFTVSPQVSSPIINSIMPIDPVLCGENGVLNFDFSNVPDGSYTLSYDGGSFSITVLGDTASLSVPAGNYNNISLSIAGCSSNAMNAIISEPLTPDSPILTIDAATCTAAGTATVSNYSSSVTYSFSSSGPLVDSSGNITGAVAGTTYTIFAEENGCLSSGSSFTVPAQLPQPMFTVVVNNPSCGTDNGEIIIEVSNIDTLSSPVVYSIGNGHLDQLGNNIFTQLSEGTYVISVSDQEGCSSTVSTSLEAEGSFYIEATPVQTTIKEGQDIDLHVDVDPDIVIDEVVWTPSNGLSCDDCIFPTASPELTTTYWVQVKSEDGCVATDSVLITVISPCKDVFIPTSFSPNNDGMNDLQCVFGECIAVFDYTIFNRWGEVVFYTSNKNVCWDGKFKGNPVQTGVYIFRLEATLENGKQISKTGNLNVTR